MLLLLLIITISAIRCGLKMRGLPAKGIAVRLLENGFGAAVAVFLGWIITLFIAQEAHQEILKNGFFYYVMFCATALLWSRGLPRSTGTGPRKLVM